METAVKTVRELEAEIARAEVDLLHLKARLAEANKRERDAQNASTEKPRKWPLKADEYDRYARQLVLPAVGVRGQLRLGAASVLIVGAGGLGCPAASYLAGAGVGTLGVVDGDVVEASNLHRQIGHATSRVGVNKANSLIAHLRGVNPLPTYVAYEKHLTSEDAVEIVERYDLVLDCTDNPASRYLISDACVVLRKPLVSASALRTDGQLIVLNRPASGQGDETGGPCYRCVFPKPPPPESVLSCGEGGILGPVVGVMGVLQALEAIRTIVAGLAPTNEERGSLGGGQAAEEAAERPSPSMLLFSASGTGPPFRSVRMRGRRRDCFACGAASGLTPVVLTTGSVDYVRFCGGGIPAVDILASEERVSPTEYNREHAHLPHVVLDVREKEHFAMGSIDGAVNVPFSTMTREVAGDAAGDVDAADRKQTEVGRVLYALPSDPYRCCPVFVVCRVGNDSQLAAEMIKSLHPDGEARWVGDIKGGMRAWKAEVDETMPFA